MVGSRQTQELGSFHQCYRLDGRLVAIGVLDLLPHAVSAVYFIYHQDFERFSFGKLSALREAALALEGQYEYYYMGFYIHSCQKMRYKAEFRPQHILDLETMRWRPLDDPEISRTLDDNEGKPDPEDIKYLSATAAANSRESVLTFGLVGSMAPEEIASTVALDEVPVEVNVRGHTLIRSLKVSVCSSIASRIKPL